MKIMKGLHKLIYFYEKRSDKSISCPADVKIEYSFYSQKSILVGGDGWVNGWNKRKERQLKMNQVITSSYRSY